MKKYLAVFDLDGTLFDTGDVNYYAYKEALKILGVELDRDFFVRECNGRHYKEFLPEIMGEKGTPENIEKVHALKKEIYGKNLGKARENKHLFQIMEGLSDSYYLSVVTTASRKNASDILRYFGYQDLVEYMVAQEDITRVKPDPQGFLMAMEHFGMDAEHTVIFEDSDVGISAAEAAGGTVLVARRF